MGGFRLIPADKMILADAMRANIGRIPFMASHQGPYHSSAELYRRRLKTRNDL